MASSETPRSRNAQERKREDYAAYGIAYLVVLVFGVISILAISGFVDLSDPTAASVVFAVLGYTAAKLDPIFARFFATLIDEVKKDRGSEEESPIPSP